MTYKPTRAYTAFTNHVVQSSMNKPAYNFMRITSKEHQGHSSARANFAGRTVVIDSSAYRVVSLGTGQQALVKAASKKAGDLHKPGYS